MRIHAKGLRKRYGNVLALDDVLWEVPAGQIVALLGPNGAGKSTFLNALAGVIPLDAGQVFLDDELYTPGRDDLRRRFAVIPDIPTIAQRWTPVRFMGSAVKLYRGATEELPERAMQIFSELDLLSVALAPFHQLSRGQAYKAILAGFLAADPELWFVDEPFASGMDPRGLNAFKRYSREASKRGGTIIYTTQIIEVAEQFSDRICILNKGRIVADATPVELCEGSKYEELLAELHESPRAADSETNEKK